MPETIVFTGGLTIEGLSRDFHLLKEAVGKGDDVVVDLSSVERIDVAAVQMILAAEKECEKNGRKATVRKSAAVADMLSSIGVQL